MRPIARPDWQQALVLLTGAFITALIVIVLYWARAVCIPLALAIFFTFVLSPLVHALQKRGLGRVPAVMVVVTGTLLTLALVGYLVFQQTLSLLWTLPKHSEQIKEKIHTIQSYTATEESDRLNRMVDDIVTTIEAKKTTPVSTSANLGIGEVEVTGKASPPAPTFTVSPAGSSLVDKVKFWLAPVAELVAQAVFATVLVVFMLIKKEDLRNRLLRLIGHGRVTTATRAIDDASARVSKYLLTQAILNVCFAGVVTVALFALRVDYAILWGILAGLLRYVPYVGGVLGALLPILYSFALGDGLWQPFAVLVMFVVVEMTTGHIIEPWLYGHSMGLSPVAQLVAASFWAFLWGPIGLVLSGPLTVCLLVIGRHSRSLEFLTVLLGDQPALEPDVMLYQRLTARDEDEAETILLGEAETSTFEQVCDRVLVPAISRTKQAVALGDLSEEEAKKVLESTARLIDVLDEATAEPPGDLPVQEERVRLVFCPARDEVDRQALDMLSRHMDPRKWDVEVTAVATLTSELLQQFRDDEPGLVVIGSVAPGGLAHVRYICKRLQARFPKLKLVVYRAGLGEPDEESKKLLDSGVSQVTFTLEATRQYVQSWQPVLTTVAV